MQGFSPSDSTEALALWMPGLCPMQKSPPSPLPRSPKASPLRQSRTVRWTRQLAPLPSGGGLANIEEADLPVKSEPLLPPSAIAEIFLSSARPSSPMFRTTRSPDKRSGLRNFLKSGFYFIFPKVSFMLLVWGI